ncbi:MAG: AraC family transcriptional regulator [Oscillospiraceae bacterium]|nr:AraC family transcriptional regulator [Oscillospiraceae bacterium]
MDWLKGMNNVIEYIEENLTQPIKYEALSKIVSCSVYEFSRIFSFMAGMSVSEYIRRRRLSQAVFDIQNSREKIIEIALKYCYESPTAFTRAFKDLHGVTPISAKKTSVLLKTYPAINFVLTIKGVKEMNFRIEKKESFQIMGLSGYITDEEMASEYILPALVNEFYKIESYFSKDYGSPFWNSQTPNYYTAPFWQVVAIDFQSVDGKTKTIIGAEYKGKKPGGIEIAIKTVPVATWAVFSIHSSVGKHQHDEAYTRILTEWFPASQYKRNESVPNLDVYPGGDASSKDYIWEIWIPVISK